MEPFITESVRYKRYRRQQNEATCTRRCLNTHQRGKCRAHKKG